jgi:hypothetical protein
VIGDGLECRGAVDSVWGSLRFDSEDEDTTVRIREAGNCLGEVFSIRVMKFAIPTVTLLFELKLEILLAGSLAHRLNIFLRADAAVKTEDVCRHGAWCVMPSS